MSIIHDALKKIEASRANEIKTKIDKGVKPKPKSYLLVAFTVCLVIFIVNIFYGWLSSTVMKDLALIDKKEAVSGYAQPSNKAAALPITPPLENIIGPPKETLPVFTLNGVFFSGAEGYALINNRIVKKGDKIEGATVVEVFLDGVDLEFDGSIIKLSTSAR